MPSQADVKIKVLSKKRETIFARLQRLYEYAKAIDVPAAKVDSKNLKAFRIMYPSLTDTVRELEELDDQINIMNLEMDEKYTLQITSFRDQVDFIRYIAKEYKVEKERELPKAVKGEETHSLVDSRMLLGKLEIPEFSGSAERWPVFSSLFVSLVDKNPNLTDLHKVSFLISRLSGAALRVCRQVPPTAENYSIIKDLLWKRYDDKRVICDNYLEKVFEFQPLKGESRENLENFLDGYCAAVAALRRLDLEDLSGRIFLYQGLKILDSKSRREFETSIRDKSTPTYEDLVEFVETHLRSFKVEKSQNVQSKSEQKKYTKTTHALVVEAAENKAFCEHCQKKGHNFVDCRKILKMSPWDRFQAVKRCRLCLKCLNSSHIASNCEKTKPCKDCDLPHHSLIHFPFKPKENTEPVKPVGPSTSTNVCAVAKPRIFKGEFTVLLSTAQVHVVDGSGRTQIVRFLLDSGSQSNFLTAETCRRLKLNLQKIRFAVLGMGGKESPVIGKTFLTFSSRFDANCSFGIEALVVEKIVEKMPSLAVEVSELSYLRQLNLADEDFSTPKEIHGVLGAELVPYLLKDRKIINAPHHPVAIESQLGFVLMGRAPVVNSVTQVTSLVSVTNLNSLLERFWAIEELPKMVHRSDDEKNCEEIYSSTVSRSKEGRYVIALPFKFEKPQLGESYKIAERRFLNLEKKLDLMPELKLAYHQVLKDFIDQGHLSLIKNPDRGQGYFIPHHCVHKASTSTPVRVVFDASAKTSLGLSLNDSLYVGPKLQADIFSLLLNFRLFRIGLCADIRQMYRQIVVREADREWQKIVWRFSKELPIQVYRHNTVVFGLSASPFLALRTIQELVRDEGESFPLAKQFIPRDMYMDDLVTSVENIEEASRLHLESKALLSLGGFKLVKWSSNVPDEIPGFSDRVEGGKEFETDNTLPVLGLVWNPEMDIFHFRLDLEKRTATKRSILSTIARIYDPVGFLAPVILYAKVLIQELWQEKADWDDEPSSTIVNKWEHFQTQLVLLTELKIPRFLGLNGSVEISLVGFCDASSRGYGAVIYILVVDGDARRSGRLLCAKSKVAPAKVQSIPRLELLAAFLLANLIKYAYEAICVRKPIKEVLAFSDSEIVLCWLKASPACWQTFVANRVSKIQDCKEITRWAHVSGKQNPADCLSRGILPQELMEAELWWNGPSWMVLAPTEWPVELELSACEPPERRSASLMVAAVPDQSNQILNLITRCSSYNTLLKIMVFVLRFVKLIPKDHETRHGLDQSEIYLCQVVQRSDFAEDFAKLQSNRLVSKQIRCLNPFLKDGLIRVGGRLSKANLGFEHTHPILLPKKHPLVNRIIDHYHQTNLHTGPHLLLAVLRQKFWILSARSVVRQRVRSCNLCFRVSPRPTYPMMADLPACRVNESKAFLHTGVDYAGPIKISIGRKRNPVISKSYICLFVCLTTKAVHLELVSDLSTELFLSAFKRFLARRGECRTMYSDNGTNFIGAKTELDELYSFMSEPKHQKILNEGLGTHRINWKFLPPNAPHFGGIWESNVKSVKTHLFKVIGLQVLTYEELNSILIQIESLLNSRPLCPLSADPSDPAVLTPAHFLMATPLKNLPSSDWRDIPQNRLSRFQLVDQMVQTFWSRWRKEYLHELQVRRKWLTDNSAVTKGTVVVIEQGHSPPLTWPLGVVEEVFPGSDGIVRVVQVRTSNGSFKRPVIKVYPLPNQ